MRESQETAGPGSLVFMVVNSMSPCLKRLEGKKQGLGFPLNLHLYGDVHTPKVTHLNTHRIKKKGTKRFLETKLNIYFNLGLREIEISACSESTLVPGLSMAVTFGLDSIDMKHLAQC